MNNKWLEIVYNAKGRTHCLNTKTVFHLRGVFRSFRNRAFSSICVSRQYNCSRGFPRMVTVSSDSNRKKNIARFSYSNNTRVPVSILWTHSRSAQSSPWVSHVCISIFTWRAFNTGQLLHLSLRPYQIPTTAYVDSVNFERTRWLIKPISGPTNRSTTISNYSRRWIAKVNPSQPMRNMEPLCFWSLYAVE